MPICLPLGARSSPLAIVFVFPETGKCVTNVTKLSGTVETGQNVANLTLHGNISVMFPISVFLFRSRKVRDKRVTNVTKPSWTVATGRDNVTKRTKIGSPLWGAVLILIMMPYSKSSTRFMRTSVSRLRMAAEMSSASSERLGSIPMCSGRYLHPQAL